MIRLWQYGDIARMGIRGRARSGQAWAAVHGLQNAGLRALQFFVNLWKVAGVYRGWGVVRLHGEYGKCGCPDMACGLCVRLAKNAGHRGDMKVYKRRSIWLDYPWRRLTKIAFYVGIGIAVSVFALFLIWSLPVVIGHTGNQWERLGNTDTDRSNGETLAKFQGHPAYVAMYERFPRSRGEGRVP